MHACMRACVHTRTHTNTHTYTNLCIYKIYVFINKLYFETKNLCCWQEDQCMYSLQYLPIFNMTLMFWFTCLVNIFFMQKPEDHGVDSEIMTASIVWKCTHKISPTWLSKCEPNKINTEGNTKVVRQSPWGLSPIQHIIGN